MILSGLSDATARYRLAINESTGLKARVAVGEALWWITAANDYLRSRVSKMTDRQGGRIYYTQIATTPEGKVLAGLVYLRNYAGHMFALALTAKTEPASAQFNVVQADGSIETRTVYATVTYNPALEDFCPKDGYYFTTRDRLPQPSGADVLNRDQYYDELIAGKSVELILDLMEQTFRQTLDISRDSSGNVRVNVTCHPVPPA
jgi:hypothetical protein